MWAKVKIAKSPVFRVLFYINVAIGICTLLGAILLLILVFII